MKMPARFECRTCGKSFSSKTNWKRHEVQFHRLIGEGDKFGCPDCGRQFIRKHDLSRHITARHTDLSKEQHTCQECEKAFGSKSLLKKHLEVHEGSADGHEKLICIHCCVPFKSAKFLERHIRIHDRQNSRKHSNSQPGVEQHLEPFLKLKKKGGSHKKSALKKIGYVEIDDEKTSVRTEGGSGECVDGNDSIADEFDDWPTLETGIENIETAKSYSGVKPKSGRVDGYVTEELNPDQYVIDYVKSRMIETQQDSHRQQFLLSLLPDVREMSTSQFRSFRHQVCNLIDKVLESEKSASQTSSTAQVSDPPSLAKSVPDSQVLESDREVSQTSNSSQISEPESKSSIQILKSFHVSNMCLEEESPS